MALIKHCAIFCHLTGCLLPHNYLCLNMFLSYSDCEEMAAEALKKTDNKVSGSNSTKLSTDCQALSFALDSRLQFGFQWLPDLHTRV